MINPARLCGICNRVPPRLGQWSCARCHRAYMADYRAQAAALRSRTTRVIEPEVILGLLADGPQSRDELALALAAPLGVVKHQLLRMMRAGQLKRTGGMKNYALASYDAKPGRPAIPGRQRQASHQVVFCRTCRRKHAKHQGLCRLCAREAGLYTKSQMELDRERMERRAAREAVEPPMRVVPKPPTPPAIVIADGIEYQTIDYEALVREQAKHWPRSASSLASTFYDRPQLPKSRGVQLV